MRYLGEGAWARRVSYLLVTTLLLPLMVFAAARPAGAQLTRTPLVAVLEFGNRANTAGAGGILGRQATDATVVEMTRTGRFDVTPRTQLNQQLQASGLTPPLDNIGIRRLGQDLGVDSVVTGDIERIVFLENPRRARVTLAVRLFDVVSGELANGAIETGVSPAPPAGFQPDDDTLINQAISNAAFLAVQTINNYTLPEATVLNTRGTTQVLINRGSRDGITPGLEFVVVRGNQRVGRIRVSRVGSTDSTADITDTGIGIRPEDRARAIFSLPGTEVNTVAGTVTTYPVVTESAGRRQRRGRNVFQSILGVGAAVLLAAFLLRPQSSNAGAPGRVTARAFADPSDVAGTGSSSRVHVTFNVASSIPQQNVQQILVYRNTATSPAEVPDVPGTGQVPIAVLPPGSRDYFDDPIVTRELTYSVVLPDGSLEDRTSTVPGFTPGTPQRYRIDVIYRRITISTDQGGGGGGTDDDEQFVQSPASNFSDYATPVARPTVLGPSGDQNPRAVTFQFSTVQGANEYIVEVADNIQFRNKKRVATLIQGPTGRVQTQPINLNGVLPTEVINTSGRQIFFRVGARNALDRPGPEPTVPNGDNFIYSATLNTFTVLAGPPPPPGGGTGTGPGTGTGTDGPPSPPVIGRSARKR